MDKLFFFINYGIQNILLGLNILLFALYGYDKLKASVHGWRISEKTLLLMGALGGGLGGFIGMFLFRHKTRKSYFYIANLIGCVLASLLLD